MAESQGGLKNIHHGRRQPRVRLLAPLKYMQISHPEKIWYDFFIPAGLAVASLSFYFLIDDRPSLFGDGGIAKSLRDILAIAIPFLFGALASVAMGLPGPYFDKRPLGAPLLLDGKALTMRQFVAYLLGYVTFLSLLLLGVCFFGDTFHQSIISLFARIHIPRAVLFYVGAVLIFTIGSFLSVSILWSLYFLTDVVNVSEDDPK